jgi:N-acetylglucosaminyldiphosphoundecaprenol N-acetyl-beta-D-mannosaminyltransferase
MQSMPPLTIPKHHSNDQPAFNRVLIDNIPFIHATVDQLAQAILRDAQQGQGGWVVTPNVDILRRLLRDPAFRQLVQDATYFTADGAPVVLASRLQGTPLPERLTGADLFTHLFRLAHQSGVRMALIGGNPGVAQAAATLLRADSPLPNVTQTLCPPMGFERDPAEMQAIQDLITAWQPDIVFVGLGCPKQEELIQQLRGLRPQAWFLGVGASFSYVCGDIQRAPMWIRRIGLEWLHRFLQEPTRLFRRYFVHGIGFGLGLVSRALWRRWSGAPQRP